MGTDLLEQLLPHIEHAIVLQTLTLPDWKYKEHTPRESLALAAQDQRGTSIRIPFEWSKQKPIWFKQHIVVPESYSHCAVGVRVSLPHGIVWLNGVLHQILHPENSIILLTQDAQPQENFFISILTEPNTHEPSIQFSHAELFCIDTTARRLYNSLIMLRDVQNTLEPHTPELKAIQELIRRTLVYVKYFNPGSEEYPNAIKRAYAFLLRTLESEYKATIPVSVYIAFLQHLPLLKNNLTQQGHNDVLKSFAPLLQLIKENPDLVLSNVGIDGYEQVKKLSPATYNQILNFINTQRWLCLGNALSLYDYHLHSPEAFIRRFQFEQSLFQTMVASKPEFYILQSRWMQFPTLPQILVQLGYKGIVQIQNEATDFNGTYRNYLWKGHDGTVIPTVITPPPLSIELCSRDFLSDIEVLMENLQEGVSTLLQLYNCHGVYHSHIDKLQVLTNLPGLPSIHLTTLQKYFEHISQTPGGLQSISHNESPSVTAQAVKYPFNLKADIYRNELLLFTAERIATLASLFPSQTRKYKYPRSEFHELWKKHFDPVHGEFTNNTATPGQYTALRKTYSEINEQCNKLKSKAFLSLTEKLPKKEAQSHFAVFNPSPWTRSDYVMLTLSVTNPQVVVTDERGKSIPTQVLSHENGKTELLCYLKDIPGLTSKTLITHQSQKDLGPSTLWKATSRSLETPWYTLRFDTKGAITSLYAKHLRRELVAKGKKINLFQLLHESSHKTEKKSLGMKIPQISTYEIKNFKILEAGPLRATLSYELRTEHQSSIRVYLYLYHATPRIDCSVSIHCKDRHTLIQSLFALQCTLQNVRYGIPCGTVVLPPPTKNEVLNITSTWVDLSDKSFGLLFNSVLPFEFTLERSTLVLNLFQTHAIPRHDKSQSPIDFTFYNLGDYVVQYSFYPHKDQLKNWEATRITEETQNPFILLPQTKFLVTEPLITVSKNNIHILSLHREENDATFIVRCYETEGIATETSLHCVFPLKTITECTLGNVVLREHTTSKNHCTLRFKPYEIKTLRIVAQPPSKKRTKRR